MFQEHYYLIDMPNLIVAMSMMNGIHVYIQSKSIMLEVNPHWTVFPCLLHNEHGLYIELNG
jgi:ABC-type lipoprotein release transport system permease subunit